MLLDVLASPTTDLGRASPQSIGEGRLNDHRLVTHARYREMKREPTSNVVIALSLHGHNHSPIDGKVEILR